MANIAMPMKRAYMEARIEADEKTFLRLNKILDEWYRKEKNHCETIGAICGCLELAGWRKEKEEL